MPGAGAAAARRPMIASSVSPSPTAVPAPTRIADAAGHRPHRLAAVRAERHADADLAGTGATTANEITA